MDEALKRRWPVAKPTIEQDGQELSETVRRDQPRLRNFIRRRVADQADAEDILQDVFYELVEAYQAVKPIEEVTAWLFRVARNRIIDLFRRKQRESRRIAPAVPMGSEGETLGMEDLLPSPDAGPEAAYARNVLLEELEEALEELPEEQRAVFIAHELLGYSFKEIAEESGVGVNTLLSRKHYAVMYLRERLQSIYEDFKNS
ncbi:MAG: RNA polymerase sigma factor [Candidatus Acidiferrales bacterium]